MISVRSYVVSCAVSLPLVVLSGTAGRADEMGGAVAQQIASRCSDFGDDFVDLGNGVCGRIGNRIRVQLGTRSSSSNVWSSDGTSNAALRSDGLGMLPGAGEPRHLRVRNGLDTYGLFR